MINATSIVHSWFVMTVLTRSSRHRPEHRTT